MRKFVCLLLSIIILGSFVLPAFAADITTLSCTGRDLGIPTLQRFPVDSKYANARSVWGVTEYEGRIYIGCGNFDTNAGSNTGGALPVYSYDPATDEWELEYTVEDEQISRFFTEWGGLYIPGIDPYASTGNVYYKQDGTWATIGGINRAVHIFDMHFMADGKTIFAGMGTNTSLQPYLSRSANGGKSWSLITFKKNGTTIKGYSGEYYRTYNVFEYKGEVYATLVRMSSTAVTANMGLFKYNSATGTMDYYSAAHENLVRNTMSVGYDFTFNGKFVNVYNGLYVYSDDLRSCEEITSPAFIGKPVCARIIGDAVYMLTYSSKSTHVESYIYKTTDLSSFDMVGAVKLPDSYLLSFDYHEGTFYMGSSWSEKESQTNGSVFAIQLERSGCTHENLITEIIADTCISDGLQTDSCPDCGYLGKTVLVSTGHSYPDEWTLYMSPSCTEEGVEGRSCGRCGETESRAVEPLGHEFSPEYTVDRPLTCTEYGQMSRHCIRCSEITDVITTPAPGHKYDNYVCITCGGYEAFGPGDCNGDSVLNILDMILAARYIAQRGYEGIHDLTGCDMSVVDLDSNGTIDQIDLNLLAEYILLYE